MKIIAAVKQVPARDSTLSINPQGVWLDESGLSWEMNEPDAYALEEALQLRERLGGEVIALSLGPARVQQTLREALAKGADRAIHVEVEHPEELDALQLARCLVDAIRPESPDVVLTGLQSDDLGYGQTGVIIAELLGFAHASIVMEVEPKDGAVRVKRELEDGFFQYVTLPLPAVLTIQSGIRRLRYATLMGIKKAKTKPVNNVRPTDFGSAGGGNIQHVFAPSRNKTGVILSGDPAQAARELIEKLRFEARVL